MWSFLLLTLAFLIFFWVKSKKKPQKSSSFEPLFTKATHHTLTESLSPTYQIPSVSLPKPPPTYTYLTEVSQSFITLLKSYKFIGVDTEESRCNSYTGKICLMQISTPNQTYILDTLANRHTIHLLQSIFSDPSITKIFHGCQNDTQWLQRDFGIYCVNVFDTQIAGKHLKMKKLGLNSLWEKYCEFQMPSEYKKSMQISNWANRPLTQEQLEYAAMDSFYLIYLMKVMLQELDENLSAKIRKETNKICLEPYELKVNIDYCTRLYQHNISQSLEARSFNVFSSLLKYFTSLSKTRNQSIDSLIPLNTIILLTKSLPSTEQDLDSLNLPKSLRTQYNEILETIKSSQQEQPASKSQQNSQIRQQKKQERYKSFLKKYTITGKVFENCQIQLPNGEILCYANQKKVKWYLDRNLAVTISTTPMIIRLNFEPNIKSEDDIRDRKYFNKEKKNECVVCASSQSFLRYRVVPLMYRQYFPEDFKHLCRHDVLLLCAPCHENANKNSEILKKTIALELNVPLNSQTMGGKFKDRLMGIRKICISVMKNKDKIPEDRRQDLLKQVNEFTEKYPQIFYELQGNDAENKVEIFSNDEKIKEFIEASKEIDWKNEDNETHGKLVMDKVTDVKGFVIRWKKFFIETMHPLHLPGSWDDLVNQEYSG